MMHTKRSAKRLQRQKDTSSFNIVKHIQSIYTRFQDKQ